jgi:hypothetical protein
MVLVQRACKESRTPAAVRLFGQKEKIYRMAFGQYVSLLNAKAVAGQTGTVQLEKSLLKYLF